MCWCLNLHHKVWYKRIFGLWSEWHYTNRGLVHGCIITRPDGIVIMYPCTNLPRCVMPFKSQTHAFSLNCIALYCIVSHRNYCYIYIYIALYCRHIWMHIRTHVCRIEINIHVYIYIYTVDTNTAEVLFSCHIITAMHKYKLFSTCNKKWINVNIFQNFERTVHIFRGLL